MSRPAVSVVIGAFNAERFIARTLASVSAQTFRDFEVIVVDDGSRDGTLAQVRQAADRDPRIRLEVRAENSGRPAVARNRALALARGDFVAFLDADDLWTPHRLAAHVSVMTRCPHLSLVYSMCRSIGVRNPLRVEFGVKPLPHNAATSRQALERGNTIPCSTVLVRRAAVLEVGGFDEDPELAAVEDYDLWLRLSRSGAIGFIPRVHGLYRVHGSSISRHTDMLERTRRLFAKRGIPVQPDPRVRGTAFMAVRATGHLSAAVWVKAVEAWQTLLGRQATVVTE